ncbi:hypothetical protein MMB232_02027 [Brevundimonas subvibrioides]|uniref:hypothetical protein n=1 Tax=Brevundimonas subvibrioides TaxID=74313 RepID=UPI0032D580F1
MKAMPGLIAAATLLAGCVTSDSSGDPFAAMVTGVPAARADAIAARIADKPLGSVENPIRVNMPPGQRDYLSRLRCANAAAPTFQRIGSTGMGPYGQIVDAYQVDCPGSTPAAGLLHLDMYHPTHVETQAPAGFTLIPR